LFFNFLWFYFIKANHVCLKENVVPICPGTDLSWYRTVFFNGCRNVLVPNCLVTLNNVLFSMITHMFAFFNLFCYYCENKVIAVHTHCLVMLMTIHISYHPCINTNKWQTNLVEIRILKKFSVRLLPWIMYCFRYIILLTRI
jgi:hypothetical protein